MGLHSLYWPENAHGHRQVWPQYWSCWELTKGKRVFQCSPKVQVAYTIVLLWPGLGGCGTTWTDQTSGPCAEPGFLRSHRPWSNTGVCWPVLIHSLKPQFWAALGGWGDRKRCNHFICGGCNTVTSRTDNLAVLYIYTFSTFYVLGSWEPVWPPAGKRKDLGSIQLRLSFLFKSCGLWTRSFDFVPHN